jgi:hypothetical protein
VPMNAGHWVARFIPAPAGVTSGSASRDDAAEGGRS